MKMMMEMKAKMKRLLASLSEGMPGKRLPNWVLVIYGQICECVNLEPGAFANTTVTDCKYIVFS